MAKNVLDQNGLLYFWQKIKNIFVAKETGKGLSTNDYTTAEKTKLAGLENYELPTASSDTKGGVKVGSGLTINSNGVLSATGGGTADAVDWANVQDKPSTFPPSTHTHAQSDVTGLVDALAGKAASNHTHTLNDLGAAAASHTHAQSDITGLADALAGKAASSHTHAQSDVTGLADALAAKIASSEKGANGGVAPLGADGLIPSQYIAGSLEDVVDGYYDATAGKFYADSAKTTELEKVVGRVYIDLTEVSGAPLMTQYRWGGSAFSIMPGYVDVITNAQIDTICAS